MLRCVVVLWVVGGVSRVVAGEFSGTVLVGIAYDGMVLKNELHLMSRLDFRLMPRMVNSFVFLGIAHGMEDAA